MSILHDTRDSTDRMGGILIGLLCCTLPLQAQDTTSTTVLPDIMPHEVEIIGTLEVSLPSLQRRPLVGFNPPPQVPPLAENRKPFIGDFSQFDVHLPGSRLRYPPMPPTNPISENTNNGFFETLFGRYFNRLVRTQIQTPLTARTHISANIDYRGQDGHKPFDNFPDIYTPFDVVEARAGTRTENKQWSIQTDAGGFYEAFDLYGMLPLDQTRPRRTGQGLDGKLLLNIKTSPLQAQLGVWGMATRIETTLPANSVRLEENRVEITPGIRFATSSRSNLWIEGMFSRGVSTTIVASGGIDVDVGSRLHLRIGVLAMRGYNDLENGDRNEKQYFSPYVRAEIMVTPRLLLYAGNAPQAKPARVLRLFQENPYLYSQPDLRPTLMPVDVVAGGSLYVGAVHFSARAGVQYMPQYRYFEATPTPHSITTQYAETIIYHTGGNISIVSPGGLQAVVGIAYREGRLREIDKAIPYFAPVTCQTAISYPFLNRRGLLHIIGSYEGGRTTHRNVSTKIDAYIDVDVEASYKITPYASILLRVENINHARNTRWENYPEPPLVINTGFQLQW